MRPLDLIIAPFTGNKKGIFAHGFAVCNIAQVVTHCELIVNSAGLKVREYVVGTWNIQNVQMKGK